jgi:hypothetical protein
MAIWRKSNLAVEYHLLWTIISYVVWYSSPADDIQLNQMILIWRVWYSSRADTIQLKQMILIWRGRYLSRADDIHPIETIFIQERRMSSMMIDSWNYNQPLEMIINHWGWKMAEIDDISSALDKYIICRKWIFHKIHLDPNYLPRKISKIHYYDNRQKTKFFRWALSL